MRIVPAFFATVALVACGPGQSSTELPAPISASRATAHWMATLSPVGTSGVRGNAMIQAVNNRQTLQLSISGGSPGASHPWHVHRGSCASAGGIVGSAASYTALGTASDGTASMTTTLATPVGGGSHYVDVHASPADDTVVACGDLTSRPL